MQENSEVIAWHKVTSCVTKELQHLPFGIRVACMKTRRALNAITTSTVKALLGC